MKMIVEGEPKEIAAFVLEVQGRQGNVVVDRANLGERVNALLKSRREGGTPISPRNPSRLG